MHTDPVPPSQSGGGEVFEAGRTHPEPWNPLVEPKALGAGGIDREAGRHDEADPVLLLADREGDEDR